MEKLFPFHSFSPLHWFTHPLTHESTSLSVPASEQNLGNPAAAGEAEPQRQGQSRVVSAAAGTVQRSGECRGDPQPQASWVQLVRLLGEGEAPEEVGRSHAARPHLLLCGMWGPCRVLSPTYPAQLL